MVNSKLAGFTLVELIVVILLVSIVSVYASSRYFGASSVDSHLIESELLSSLRLTQLRAMHRNGFCGRWLVEANQAAHVSPSKSSNVCVSSIRDSGVENDTLDSSFVDAGLNGTVLSLTTNNATNYIDFNSLGRPAQCTTSSCQLRWTVSSGASGLICINTEGGIYAC
ncbi:MSHA biogenesis protein MshC [Vibrio galatheae]|uniref:MSHA biogenesis protein MshC n=1 Tax=Vibrio galatheae TaxID=579748 RepID=A0A0F4NGJ3_9VIBR|nr:prepilin-type N-terminal cleavage/methylation domain-containing protein [Vibrio galatheae]KJY82049.1 MSHA biogenesis protein MshC [Vibrio galatheae]